MNKGKAWNVIQRSFIFCCVALVAMLTVFTDSDKSKAGSYSKYNETCTLQSITMEIDGKEYTFEGDLDSFVVVDGEKEWSEILSGIKIVDFKLLTSDVCTSSEPHDEISMDLFGEYYDNIAEEFLTFSGGSSGNKMQADETLEVGDYTYYDLYYDAKWGYLDVFLVKEYDIQYELDGGSFPEGVAAPTTYNSYDGATIPVPEKEGYVFVGWTLSDDDEPMYPRDIEKESAGAFVYTAHWKEGERIDISDDSQFRSNYIFSNTRYTGEEIKASSVWIEDFTNGDNLGEGTDFIVTYKNNIEIGNEDSDNPPTLVIIGVGQYKGRIEMPFTIEKGLLERVGYNGNISVASGDKLSTFDLNQLSVCVSDTDKIVAGTWKWENPDTIVKGDYYERYVYEATFTPMDTVHYEIFKTEISVKVLPHLRDAEITFVEEESFTYDGEEKKPTVTVVYDFGDGDTSTLKDRIDYKITYKNNINAGDKSSKNVPTVVIRGLGDYMGTVEVPFTIDKASVSIEKEPIAAAIIEGQKLSESALTAGQVVDVNKEAVEGTFAWKDGEVVPTLADSGVTKYTAVFTAKDSGNYETVETDVVVTVNQKANEGGEGSAPTPQPQPTPNPEAGTKIEDAEKKATYVVVKNVDGVVEVTYVKPTKKTTSVTIPDTVTLSDATKAKVTAIDAKAFKDNKTIKSITIGKNVATIGSQAFKGCKNLKTVKGAKGLKKIGKEAFANCTKLTSIAIGNSLESIAEKAFYNCKALKNITIPKKVKSIGKSAFQGCKNLKTINIKTTKLTKKNVKKNAFKGIYAKAKIDVPNSKKKAYTSMLRSRGVSKKAKIK